MAPEAEPNDDGAETRFHTPTAGSVNHDTPIAPELARSNEDYNRRTQALESLKLTGNIVTDTRRFFEIAEIDVASLQNPHPDSIESGDAAGILTYLKLRKERERPPYDDMGDEAKNFWKVFYRVMSEIIAAEDAN